MHGGGTGRPGRACKVLEFINNWANLIIHKPCDEPQTPQTNFEAAIEVTASKRPKKAVICILVTIVKRAAV